MFHAIRNILVILCIRDCDFSKCRALGHLFLCIDPCTQNKSDGFDFIRNNHFGWFIFFLPVERRKKENPNIYPAGRGSHQPIFGHTQEVKSLRIALDLPSEFRPLAGSTLGVGGHGTAHVTGNVAPREMAELSKPWRSLEDVVKGRELYFEYLTEGLERQVASFNFSFQKFRYLFVTGSLRSFPKARWVIFTPGGVCLRLYSFRSTI